MVLPNVHKNINFKWHNNCYKISASFNINYVTYFLHISSIDKYVFWKYTMNSLFQLSPKYFTCKALASLLSLYNWALNPTPPSSPTWPCTTSTQRWCESQCPLNVRASFSLVRCCLCLLLKEMSRKGSKNYGVFTQWNSTQHRERRSLYPLQQHGWNWRA